MEQDKMKKIMTFLTALTLFSAAFGELKVYDRLGGFSEVELNEVYQLKDSNPPLFVKLSDLPIEYQSRISKNSDRFVKVDASKVKEGTMVSKTTNVQSFTKEIYAKAEDDLYKMSEKNVYININTVEESKKALITENCTHVGVSLLADEDARKELVAKVNVELSKLLGLNETKEQFNNKNVEKLIKDYEITKNKNFGELLNNIDKEITKYKNLGDLKKVQDCMDMKEKIVSNNFSENDLSNGVLKSWNNYKKTMGSETRVVVDKLKVEVSRETKAGNLAEASKIQAAIDAVDKRFVEEEKKEDVKKEEKKEDKKISFPYGKWRQVDGERYIIVNKDGTWISHAPNFGGSWKIDKKVIYFISENGNSHAFSVDLNSKESYWDLKNSKPLMRWENTKK
jgi:hypothetical protein